MNQERKIIARLYPSLGLAKERVDIYYDFNLDMNKTGEILINSFTPSKLKEWPSYQENWEKKAEARTNQLLVRAEWNIKNLMNTWKDDVEDKDVAVVYFMHWDMFERNAPYYELMMRDQKKKDYKATFFNVSFRMNGEEHIIEKGSFLDTLQDRESAIRLFETTCRVNEGKYCEYFKGLFREI